MGSYAYPDHVPHPGSVNFDLSFSEDDDFPFKDEVEDDRDILRPSTHALGLSRSYVGGWTRQDAFREFYQNW